MTTLSVTPSAKATARLMRRAHAAARLRHPNLVRMLSLPGGAGLAPVLGAAHRLSDFTLPAGTFKRFDLEQVVRLLIDVCSGLSALHEVVTDGEPFVHGAVAPQHIYIDEHGTARVVPLLPAHFSAHAKVEKTGYVAPERLLEQPLDARADVFSVGVLLWEALSGKRLSADGSLDCLLTPGQRPPAIQLSARLRWAQPLCAVAERAIAREPRGRFASMLELSRAMEQAAAERLPQVDVDAWQEEAPTPVFQPRIHLANLRTSTPPPAVLTLPDPSALATAPTVPAMRASATEAPELLIEPAPSSSVRPQGSRRGRGMMIALSAIALGFAVALPGKLQHATSVWTHGAAAAARFPGVALAILPWEHARPKASAAVPAEVTAAPAPSSAVTPPASSEVGASKEAPAAPSTHALIAEPPRTPEPSHSAAPARSATTPHARVKPPLGIVPHAAPAAKGQGTPRGDDYGI